MKVTKYQVADLGFDIKVLVSMKHREDKYYYSYIDINKEELKNRMKETLFTGYANKFDIEKEIKDSVTYLERYRKEVEDFCQKEQSVSLLKYAMNTFFRAIFLDVYSMMEIIKKKKIIEQISKVRSEYLQAMKLNKSLNLSAYISLDELNNIINQYKKIVDLQIFK